VTEFTGERVIPGQVEPDLWAEHFSRYRFAASLSKSLLRPPEILDIGCGAGYGTAALAESASSATGIDLAPDAIDYARAHYTNPHLRFLPGSAMALPFADASFDLITAFEVIEHLADGATLLAEARRVLRPNGVLLVSTPNTTYYAETRAQEGPNPYHVHEFTFDEFASAIHAIFPSCTILLQNHTDAFCFYDPTASRPEPGCKADGYVETIAGTPADAHFFLAVCSLHPLPDLPNFIYVPAATNLLRTREHHIKLLQGEIEDLKAIIARMQDVVATANAERDSMMRVVDEQNRHLEAQNQWARQLDQELKQKVADLQTAVDALDTAEHTVIERTQWAQRLDAELHSAQEKLHHVQASRWVRLGRQLGLGPKIDRAKIGNSKNDKNA
jgi:SAM-dependent methyltransferase